MIHKGTYDGTIYHNPANRFCIISVKTADKEVPLEARSTRRYRDHLIRFVATGYELPRTDAVELELDGEWKQGKYGMQFQVEQWRQIVPRTKSGVEGYLASGLIKGIGPATAALIVSRFGEDTLDILQKQPERLLEIKGITESKLEEIKTSYAESRMLQDLLVLLSPFKITPKTALKIYQYFGPASVDILKKSPFELCQIAELNKVPDFDPLKFLRRTKDSMRLDLPYQKLWFRMAHPNGRMRVTALRITEQMAIFEARVFLDRSDAEPFSMSVAQQQLQDNRDFIRGAQNEALSQALTDAGFGIQLISAGAQAAVGHKKADATEKKAAEAAPIQVERTEPRQTPASTPQKPAAPAAGDFPSNGHKTQQRAPVAPETAVTALPVEPVEQRLPVEPVKAEKVVPTDTVMATAEPGAVEQTDELPLPTQKAEMRIEPKGNDAPAQDEAPAYTQNTPVEELLQVMTLEQARQVVVDDGICRGMTIAQVAEKRPVNLRFYLIPGKSKNNLVRAAAQLVLDSLQKAG